MEGTGGARAERVSRRDGQWRPRPPGERPGLLPCPQDDVWLPSLAVSCPAPNPVTLKPLPPNASFEMT